QHPSDRSEITLPLQHARETSEVGLKPVLLGVALRGEAEVVDHGVDVIFQLCHFTAGLDLNRTREVAFGHSSRDFSDSSHLIGEVVGQEVHVAYQVLPGSGSTRNVSLTAKPAFHAHLAGHGRYLVSERGKRVSHVVDGFGQGGDFSLGVHRQFLCEHTVGDRGYDFHDATNLFGQVCRHHVDVIREIFPRAGHTGHLRLSAQFAFRAHFAGDTSHFCSEGVQLVHHGVDGVLQLENFALHVDGDFSRQVAAGDGRGDLCDVSDLGCEVASHEVHVVGQIFPGSAHSGHIGLTTQPAFAAHLARYAGYLAGEGVQLIHHGVNRLFEQQNLAADIDGNLLGQIASGNGSRDFGDVSPPRRSVAGHEVDVVGEILPGTGHAGHLCLTTQLAFGSDLAGHTRHFAGEGVQLVHHGVDGVLEFENFALNVDRNLAGE